MAHYNYDDDQTVPTTPIGIRIHGNTFSFPSFQPKSPSPKKSTRATPSPGFIRYPSSLSAPNSKIHRSALYPRGSRYDVRATYADDHTLPRELHMQETQRTAEAQKQKHATAAAPDPSIDSLFQRARLDDSEVELKKLQRRSRRHATMPKVNKKTQPHRHDAVTWAGAVSAFVAANLRDATATLSGQTGSSRSFLFRLSMLIQQLGFWPYLCFFFSAVPRAAAVTYSSSSSWSSISPSSISHSSSSYAGSSTSYTRTFSPLRSAWAFLFEHPPDTLRTQYSHYAHSATPLYDASWPQELWETVWELCATLWRAAALPLFKHVLEVVPLRGFNWVRAAWYLPSVDTQYAAWDVASVLLPVYAGYVVWSVSPRVRNARFWEWAVGVALVVALRLGFVWAGAEWAWTAFLALELAVQIAVVCVLGAVLGVVGSLGFAVIFAAFVRCLAVVLAFLLSVLQVVYACLYVWIGLRVGDFLAWLRDWVRAWGLWIVVLAVLMVYAVRHDEMEEVERILREEEVARRVSGDLMLVELGMACVGYLFMLKNWFG